MLGESKSLPPPLVPHGHTESTVTEAEQSVDRVEKAREGFKKTLSGNKSSLMHQSMRKQRQRSGSVWGGHHVGPQAAFIMASPDCTGVHAPFRGSGRRMSVTSVISRLDPVEPLTIPDESLLQTIEAQELKKACLNLDELPAELAEVMRRYDSDANGVLDREESIHAAADLARMRHIIEQGVVHLEAFPEHAMYLLEEHDKDQDGALSVQEMIEAFRALERERTSRRMWMRFTLASVIFSGLLLCALGGLLYYVLEVSKDSTIDTSTSLMVAKDTNQPVRTASVEFAVQNGILVDRTNVGSCAGGDDHSCPIRVAEGGQEGAVSSLLSDDNVRELKALRLASGNNWMQLRVMAVSRLEDAASDNGSILILSSHGGELAFDGNVMAADARLAGLLRRSGFEIASQEDSGGRFVVRGMVEVTGTFNAMH